MSTDPQTAAEACIAFRKILSIDHKPPIDQVLQAGILPRLKQFLAETTRPQVQLEACWALTNIASGNSDQTQAVVESGVVPHFVDLLRSSDASLQEQAMWAVANIAGDRPEYRDGCISVGTVEALSVILENAIKSNIVQMARLGAWGVSNMCRGKPAPDFERLAAAVPALSKALSISNDTEVLADTAWALSYLTDTANSETVLRIISFVDLKRLVSLLAHPSNSVHTPVLRTIGNLVSGESELTRRVVSAGGLSQLKSLVLSNKKNIRKESLWAISNVCADSEFHVHSVIDSGAMDRVCDLLRSGATDTDIRKEAVWCICNSCSVGNESQIRQLVTDSRFRIIELLSDSIESSKDTKTVTTCLTAMKKILASAGCESENPYTAILEECGGLTTIEDLQLDESEDIYEAAVDILETFFTCDEDGLVVRNENIVFDFTSKQPDPNSFTNITRSG